MYNEDIVKTLTCCVRFSLSLSLFVSRSMVALFGGSTSSQNMMHAVTRVNLLPLETRRTSPQRIHGSQSVSMYPHNRSPFGRIVCEPIRAEHKRTNGDRRFKQTRNLISEPLESQERRCSFGDLPRRVDTTSNHRQDETCKLLLHFPVSVATFATTLFLPRIVQQKIGSPWLLRRVVNANCRKDKGGPIHFESRPSESDKDMRANL